MADLPLLICGQGRCGTSLCMSMLQAGGVPVAGHYPSYEDDALLRSSLRATDIRNRYAGRAVKWLSPVVAVDWARPWAHVIYLCRDETQQAKSALKLLGVPANRRAVRSMAAGIRADDRKAKNALVHAGPMIVLHFEEMISKPDVVAAQLAKFVQPFMPNGFFDQQAACQIVRTRGTDCSPDLSIEVSQVMYG
jgi:hypothetical protein